MANRLTPGLSTPSIRFFALRADVPASINASEPGLSVGWRRSLDGAPLAASFTALTIANLGTVNAAHSAGGLIVIDAATGEHRLDLPSTAAASGADAIDLQASATDTNLLFVVPPITIDAQVANAATQSKLLKYTQLLARKDAAIATDNAAELAEINADGGSGAGAFDNTSDAQEGIRDNQGAGGAGVVTAVAAAVDSGQVRSPRLLAPIAGRKVWAFTFVDQDGNAVDVNGANLRLTVENGSGDDLFSVAAVGAGNTASFATTSVHNGQVGEHKYSVRNEDDDNFVLAYNDYVIFQVPKKD